LVELIQRHLYIVSINKCLSIQDAAKYMGVSPQTLRRWERAGKILQRQVYLLEVYCSAKGWTFTTIKVPMQVRLLAGFF